MWRGSLPFIFTGDHAFEFHPSEITPGSTRFAHYEDFSGILSFMMSAKSSSGASAIEGFDKFNKDLKERCESGV